MVTYWCQSWTIRKAEHWRIDAFQLWCWRRLLRVPWTARRSNQSILKEIRPEDSVEGLMLKLQSFGHLMQRPDYIGKDPDAGKDWRREEKGTKEDGMVGWHHRLDGHEFEQALGYTEGQGSLAWDSHGVSKSQLLSSNDWATEQRWQQQLWSKWAGLPITVTNSWWNI